MRFRAVLLCIVAGVAGASAAFERQAESGRALGLGCTGVALDGLPWGSSANPALIGSIDRLTVGFSYAPDTFGLRELSRAAATAIIPMAGGSGGLRFSRFGFDLYREVQGSLAFGMAITDQLSVGLAVSFFHLAILRYGSASAIGVDAGALVRLTPEVHWGAVVTNINSPSLASGSEKLPRTIGTGIAWTPLPDLLVSVELTKDVRFPAEFHAGVAYKPVSLVELRGGTTQDPSTVNAGVGIHYLILTLDYAFTSHPELGMSHHFSLTITPGD